MTDINTIIWEAEPIGRTQRAQRDFRISRSRGTPTASCHLSRAIRDAMGNPRHVTVTLSTDRTAVRIRSCGPDDGGLKVSTNSVFASSRLTQEFDMNEGDSIGFTVKSIREGEFIAVRDDEDQP